MSSYTEYSGTPLQWNEPLLRGGLISGGRFVLREVYLGLSEMAFVLTSGVACMRGSSVTQH